MYDHDISDIDGIKGYCPFCNKYVYIVDPEGRALGLSSGHCSECGGEIE